jgi:iron complex outermembrane recepter protein
MKAGYSAKTAAALSSAVTCCCVLQVANAQQIAEQAPDQGSNTGGGLSEVTVYAQRKASGESIQSVPLSVTGVDGAAIQNLHVENLSELGRLAPNVNLDSSGTHPLYPNFYIRGIGNSATTRSIDPAINIIQDGMVVGYQAGALADTFDLEGVEVLRGPQGVLFGRNATGGAVVMRTARPTDQFQAKAQVTLGNADTVEFKGSVGGPVVEDRVLAKIAFMSKNDNGLWHNTLDGTFVPAPLNPSGTSPQHDVGGASQVHEYTVKPTFVVTPAQDVRLTLFTQYHKANDGAGAIYAIPDPPGAPPSGLKSQLGFTPSTEPYTVNLSNTGYINLEESHAIGELVLDKVAGGAWTTVAAYRHVIYDNTVEADGTPFTLYLFGPNDLENNHQYSLESRYNVPLSSWMNLLVGVYGYSATSNVWEKRTLNGIFAGQSFATNVEQVTTWRQKDDTAAGFMNVDLKPLAGLTVSGGMRYGWERKEYHVIPLGTCTGPAFTGCPSTYYDSSRHWWDLSPRGVISYALTDNNLIYANYSKGFRSGNYNGRATTVATAITPANPEKVDSYEIGSKNDFFAHRLRANIAGFYENYNDIQRVVQVASPNGFPAQNLTNAAKAKVYGAELEVSWLPVDVFRLDTSVGYIRSHFDSFNGLPPLSPGLTVSDLELDHVSKWTANAAGTWSFKVPNVTGDWDLRASYTYRSRFFEDAQNTPYFVQPGFGILDASLTYSRDSWRISAFGRNLQNTVFSDFMTRVFNYIQGTGQPRTYGIEVTVMSH